MSPDELAYYWQRAHVERKHAADAANPIAQEIHEELACLYEQLVELERVERPTLTIITPEPLSA